MGYLQWKTVSEERWSYRYEERRGRCLYYRITQIPVFSDHRFEYLNREIDQRAGEVVRRQMTMLRQFHELGGDWGISFRIIKDGSSLVIYLVFRYSDVGQFTQQEIENADLRIRNAFPGTEYTIEPVSRNETRQCNDLSWAREVAEIVKNEQEYQGDIYPNGDYQSFYVPYSWTPADNNMEEICTALVRHPGKAVVDVTMIPSMYLDDEKMWMNANISFLKDCMNGETFRSEKGRILWQGKKLPILKTPLDNCEKMNKQFETSRIFLASIRVFAEKGAQSLASALIVNSTRSEGQVLSVSSSDRTFAYLVDCYANVDVSAALHTSYWYKNPGVLPFRAQRLSRLYSVEEISNFFRFPVPVRAGFPGFEYDTGLGSFKRRGSAHGGIRLGNYQDDTTGSREEARFDRQQLAKHGLIVGVPGSGKTTAMFNILDQLWNAPPEERIPFIVLEPAKTEYRALKNLPEFQEDMLVFSLGDESVSPFRFNPLEVLPGIKLESHMSKLQACFTGAFDLFDPLPIFLEQAIRRTYQEKGWYEDSRGGDPGAETPTLSDLCRNAEYIVANSDFDAKMRGDFKASLLERLNSLRRGSKGRMLDTPRTIPMDELMGRPVIMALDSLNGDEKSLMMMFLLTYVFEYCKVMRRSGSPLRHMLLVEEAHNLIPASGKGSDNRADPKAHTIELFVNMLAEMRALGQGILIADQLPTAIAPQAVKQTNVKILMRVTAKDDREEIGNTMDLNEEQMHQVVNFKTGHAYLYHEGEDRVRMIRMINFKEDHDVDISPSDEELHFRMRSYELTHPDLFRPFPQCSNCCETCNRRVRNQAESFVRNLLTDKKRDVYRKVFSKEDAVTVEEYRKNIAFCSVCMILKNREEKRIKERYHEIGECFGSCVYIHLMNMAEIEKISCPHRQKFCSCNTRKWEEYIMKYGKSN